MRRLLKYLLLVTLVLAFLGLGTDNIRLNPAQQVALPHTFSLLRWEAANLLSKWVHKVATYFPWRSAPELEGAALVLEYFRLGEEILELDEQLGRAASLSHESTGDTPATLQDRLDDLKSARRELRLDVEEVMESVISAALVEEGIASWGELIYPPVDIRLDRPPKVLVTSPRDRIARKFDVLVVPDVTVQESEAMERELLDDWDLAGLVTSIGGMATYPASVNNNQSLKGVLNTASHEWVHHYLVGRLTPLGLNSFSSPRMLTLNETLADLVGAEISSRALEILTGEPGVAAVEEEEEGTGQRRETAGNDQFDFDLEMRKTRLRVDQLLAGGAIEEAEAYMEEQRRLFVANGQFIRKINQAYFAFFGTYGENPQSVSPVAGQLREFRALVPDLGSFLSRVSGFSSHKQFLGALDRLRGQPTP